MSRLAPLFFIVFLLALGAGFYLSRTPDPPSISHQGATNADTHPRQAPLPANKPIRRPAHRSTQDKTDIPTPPFALENERVARFKDDAAYRKFLASLKRRGLTLLGKSDRLRAVRFGFGADSFLDDIDGAELTYNYLVTIPEPPDVKAQPSAVGFGGTALSWLGVTTDNSDWGKGVTVAVLDSGVNNHPALNGGNGNITRINLTELEPGSKQLGHGTAVASIISGDHRLARGVAPASDILSIRITDAEGTSDSFTLAEGILAASDAGAQIINISLGSYGNSPVVADAVRIAQEKGAVIVASSGNEGLDTLAYPAGYEGVIAVGAVEGTGEHLNFSNSSKNLDITAPGYQVNAAWGDQQLTAFSGTSASAPFISGAIAVALSENPQLSPQQAADLVLSLSNEAGLPGDDPAYGSGILALDRIIEHGTPGIYDAAIASQVLIPATGPNSLPQVLVTIQNQGTETLINSAVKITSPSGIRTLNISSLTPGQIQTFRVPIALPADGSSVSVTSTVQATQGDKDLRNNSKVDRFAVSNSNIHP